MSFRQWINTEYGGQIYIFYETRDLIGAANAAYIIEGGRTYQLDKRWSARMDNPHSPNMQQHTHVMFRGQNVSIINRDGTQSHGTNRDQVPNWVIDRIRGHGLIEGTLFVEGSLHEELHLTYRLLSSAHRMGRWSYFLSTIGR